mgnify:CR=1 FL=1
MNIGKRNSEKIPLRNLGKHFVMLLLVLAFCIPYTYSQESKKVRSAKKKADKRKRHFNLQSKEVQQRMKENDKLTKQHYANKTRRNPLEGIFHRKSKHRHGR